MRLIPPSFLIIFFGCCVQGHVPRREHANALPTTLAVNALITVSALRLVRAMVVDGSFVFQSLCHCRSVMSVIRVCISHVSCLLVYAVPCAGVCSNEGSCECLPHYFGGDCSIYCDPSTTCSGHGLNP